MTKTKQIIKKILPESFILYWHKIQAIIANIRFGFPAKKMIIIGVTGTNGKTTTVNLISSILQTAGYKTAHLSTINFRIGQKVWPNEIKMTTIPSYQMQKFLSQALKAGCEYAVIEATSHAVVQNRIWGIPFDVMVFTNLTHEHLDYHKNMTKYKEAKGRFFEGLDKSLKKPGVNKISVVNEDDPTFNYFWHFPADIKFSYRIGAQPKAANDIVARRVFSDIFSSSFNVTTPYGNLDLKLALPGRFNISNCLAAICVALSQNIDLKNIKKGIEEVKQIPGRMERIDEGQNFEVIVDYAHTPDALQKIYQTVKALVRGKIISVLGAAGDRDKTKRPIMGALAGQWADLVIITNEDPYTEDPQKIIDEVANGVPKGKKGQELKLDRDYYKIKSRKEAINFAFQEAESGDLVIITGKGAELSMVVDNEKIPWDERQIVRDLLKKYLSHRHRR